MAIRFHFPLLYFITSSERDEKDDESCLAWSILDKNSISVFLATPCGKRAQMNLQQRLLG